MDVKQESASSSDSEWTTESEEGPDYSPDSDDEEEEPLKPGYIWVIGVKQVGLRGFKTFRQQVPAAVLLGDRESSSSSDDNDDIDDDAEFDKDEDSEKKVDSADGDSGSQEEGDKGGAGGSQEGGGTGDAATAVGLTQLVPMMAECKTGDFLSLQKVAGNLRSFLTENKEGLDKLLETKEFLPFLKNCLAAKPGFPSLRRDASWIFAYVLEDEEDTIAEKIGDIDVASKLLEFLKSSNSEVREQAAKTLGLLASHFDPKSVVLAMDLLEILKKIMKSPELTENMNEYISNIIWGLYRTPSRLRPVRGEYYKEYSMAEVPSIFPSLAVVKKSLPIISTLLDCDIEKIREQMLQVMCSSLVVLMGQDKLNVFIKYGLAAKLVSFLPRRDPPCTGVAVALGTIATKDRRQLLRFLQSLDGSEGLRDFWKCFVYDEEDLEDETNRFVSSAVEAARSFTDQISSFVVEDLHRGGDDLTFTNAVIKSGHAHALAACMKNSDCAKIFRDEAALHLGNLSYSIYLPKNQKEVIAEMEILPYAIDFLKSESLIAEIGSAAIIGMLAQNNAERRDLAVELGTIDLLVNIIKNLPTTSTKYWYKFVRPIMYILKTEPLISIDAIMEVPNALAVTFGSIEENTRIYKERVLEVNLEIIEQLLRYGTPAIGLILRTSGLVQKMTDYKKYAKEPYLQQKAAESILHICQAGSSEQRRALVEQGLGDQFKNFLRALSKEARKKTLECLLLIVNEDKSMIPKSTLRQLKTVIQREVKMGNSETLELAQVVNKKIQD